MSIVVCNVQSQFHKISPLNMQNYSLGEQKLSFDAKLAGVSGFIVGDMGT